MRRLPAVFWLDMAVKAALIGLLLLAVLRPDLPQFEGKAMSGRALTYPLAAVVVPVGWWVWGRRAGWRYPYGLDICLVLPFLVDVVGNALDASGSRAGKAATASMVGIASDALATRSTGGTTSTTSSTGASSSPRSASSSSAIRSGG